MIKPYSLVEIEWRDSEYCINAGWKTIEEANQWFSDRLLFSEIGYYIRKDKHFIFLCSGYSKQSDGRFSQISGIKTIPLGCVRKIRKLK